MRKLIATISAAALLGVGLAAPAAAFPPGPPEQTPPQHAIDNACENSDGSANASNAFDCLRGEPPTLPPEGET